MTDTAQYTCGKANKAASYIIQLLQTRCQRIHLAGSLRRMRPQVKDIEIVCIPKKEVKQSGLFSDIKEEITDRNFIEALATITDAIIRGSAEGRYMQIKTNSKLCPDIYLDLFMPQPEDYYRIYAIRTGSAAYAQSSRRLEAQRMGRGKRAGPVLPGSVRCKNRQLGKRNLHPQKRPGQHYPATSLEKRRRILQVARPGIYRS
ncbi:MAG: hypothetical protein IPH18_18255 [Chitinophagaceae bacterium]|nr:hypothetical protein [Chitinophagaceae bacterium]